MTYFLQQDFISYEFHKLSKQQHYQLGTKSSNAWDYEGHFPFIPPHSSKMLVKRQVNLSEGKPGRTTLSSSAETELKRQAARIRQVKTLNWEATVGWHGLFLFFVFLFSFFLFFSFLPSSLPPAHPPFLSSYLSFFLLFAGSGLVEKAYIPREVRIWIYYIDRSICDDASKICIWSSILGTCRAPLIGNFLLLELPHVRLQIIWW